MWTPFVTKLGALTASVTAYVFIFKSIDASLEEKPIFLFYAGEGEGLKPCRHRRGFMV